MLLTPLSAVSLTSRTWFSELSESIAPFHPGLALFAGAVGGVAVIGFSIFGRPRGAGRLSLLAVIVLVLLAQQSIVTIGVALVLAMGAAGVGMAWRQPDSGLVPGLALFSLIGVWAAVPDTEPALIAGAVIGVPVLLRRVVSAHRGDRAVAIGLVIAVAVIGSAGRVEVVGGLACLGLLLAPLGGLRTSDRAPIVLVGALHGVIVFVASRAVTRLEWSPAILVSVLISMIGVLGCWVISSRYRRDLPSNSSPAGAGGGSEHP